MSTHHTLESTTPQQSPLLGAVVVGVEGNRSDKAPLGVAITEARRHRRPLHLVHATAVSMVPWTPERLARQDAVTRTCLEQARAMAPDLTVTAETVVDEPTTALLSFSDSASLLVLGPGRFDRVGSVLLRATTDAVASRAHCPVMIVPDHSVPAETGAVVVGIEDERSRPALDWALEEASVRGARLIVLHGCWDELGRLSTGPEAIVPSESQRLEVAEIIAGSRTQFPDVRVKTEYVRGHRASVLDEASEGAQLLIVGTRGHNGFASLVLGSMSRHVAHHAHCPVVVVAGGPRSA